MRTQALVGIVVALAAFAPRWAAAEQSGSCTVHADQDERRTEARNRFQAGQRLAEQQLFTEALTAYECSFQNLPHPSTLYNIGRAAELCGRFQRALDAWRGYLRMNPDADDRAEIQQRIRGLESAVASGSTGTTGTGQTGGQGTGQGTGTAAPSPPPASAAAPQQWETPEGAPTDVYTPGEAGQEVQVVERRQPSPWRTFAWYFLGGGVGLAAIGLYLAIPEINDYAASEDAQQTWMIAGWSMVGLGSALAISAILIYVFSEPGGEYVVTRRAALAPSLAFGDDGRVTGGIASYLMRF